MNAAWTDDGMALFDDVDISVAVAIPDGLITPIMRKADQKGLATISREMKDLAGRARAGKLKPEEFQGGGFSISNMGMFGVTEFAAIINPPQAAILAVAAGQKRPVVKNDALAIATVMTCTLSVDHRVVDGALGARWLRGVQADRRGPAESAAVMRQAHAPNPPPAGEGAMARLRERGWREVPHDLPLRTTPADIPTLHRLMRDFATYEKLQDRFRSPKPTCTTRCSAPQPAASTPSWPTSTAATVGFALWYFTFGTFSGRYGPVRRGHLRRAGASRPRHRPGAVPPHGAHRAWRDDCVDMEWHVLDWNTPAIEFYRPHRRQADCAAGSPQATQRRRADRAGRRSRQWLTRPSTLSSLGGGPGGYVAAIRAAQLGMKTAVVEREHLGGICLNWGCIPTKALLRTSEINHLLHHLPDFGFAAVEPRFEIDKVVKRSRAVAKQLSQGVAHLLRKNKVTVFDGAGKLAGKQTLAVEKDGKPVATLKSPHIILATGARARQLPGIEADGKLIWTYKEAMVPPAMPKSLLVIGSGAIGIEFASFYRNMGAEVTVVEVLPRILPVEDEEISAFAHKAFEKQGMRSWSARAVKGAKKGARQRHRHGGGGRQEPGHHGGSGDLRRRHRRQRGGDRAGRHRREGRSHACGDRRILPHRRAWRLCDRRPRGPAVARAQGEP